VSIFAGFARRQAASRGAGLARGARQTERSGGQKGRGLGGRNFCPPSLSAAAEFRAS